MGFLRKLMSSLFSVMLRWLSSSSLTVASSMSSVAPPSMLLFPTSPSTLNYIYLSVFLIFSSFLKVALYFHILEFNYFLALLMYCYYLCLQDYIFTPLWVISCAQISFLYASTYLILDCQIFLVSSLFHLDLFDPLRSETGGNSLLSPFSTIGS